MASSFATTIILTWQSTSFLLSRLLEHFTIIDGDSRKGEYDTSVKEEEEKNRNAGAMKSFSLV